MNVGDVSTWQASTDTTAAASVSASDGTSNDAPMSIEMVRQIGLDARAELSAEYRQVLRSLPPGVRLQQAFALWRHARGALVRQGLRRGLTPDQARQDAARRMLVLHDDPTT